MNTLKRNVLTVMAFVFAFGAAFATSLSVPTRAWGSVAAAVCTFATIITPQTVGNSCSTTHNGTVCRVDILDGPGVIAKDAYVTDAGCRTNNPSALLQLP